MFLTDHETNYDNLYNQTTLLYRQLLNPLFLNMSTTSTESGELYLLACLFIYVHERGTLYPQKLALTSLTSGGRSVDIVRSRTQTTEFFMSMKETQQTNQ
jgi:hypothetical protein